MSYRERLLEALKDGPKTNRELKAMLSKSARVISATVSQNLHVFLRLEKGFVGLAGRDEHLSRWKEPSKLWLYMKMINLMMQREVRLETLYKALPDEKKVSIRATVNMRPDLFIRVAKGVYGRAGRDEWLIEKYALAKESTKARKPKRITISEQITSILLAGPKTLKEIHHLMPKYPRNSITSKLSLNPRFEKQGDSKWTLEQ